MGFIVSSIPDVFMNKIHVALWISVRIDEWRVERAIIASNALNHIEIFFLILTVQKLEVNLLSINE